MNEKPRFLTYRFIKITKKYVAHSSKQFIHIVTLLVCLEYSITILLVVLSLTYCLLIVKYPPYHKIDKNEIHGEVHS